MDSKTISFKDLNDLRDNGTVAIPLVNWEDFQKKFAKLARKAAKLDLPEMSYTVEEELLVRGRCTCNMAHECEPDCKSHQLAPFFVVSVQGPEQVRIDGWKVVAAIEHTRNDNEDNFVDRIGKFEGDLPESAFNGAPHCEHCKTDRRRFKTYFLADENNSLVQVGSTCLKDFSGHKNAAEIAKWHEYVNEVLASDSDEEDWFGGSGKSLTSVSEILAYSALVIRTEGWVSSTRAREFETASTASVVSTLMFDLSQYAKELRRQFGRPTDSDREAAQQAIEWALSHEGYNNEYRHNCRIAAQAGHVDHKRFNLVVSMIPSATNAREKALEKKAKKGAEAEQFANSEWVSEPKKRSEYTLTIVGNPMFIDNDWGGSTLYRFNDGNGNLLITFASGSLRNPETHEALSSGATFVAKATVKAHNEFRGTKQTQLTRVKVLSLVTEEEETVV